ncbi:protein phosphatase 2C domain-containing protein [Gemmatimonadota bacterium]
MLREHAAASGEQSGTMSGEDTAVWLMEAVQDANRRVKEEGERDPSVRGMGATVTALAVFSDTLVLAHVGDSRAYQLRGGELRQLSTDHTFVGEMVARGHLTREEARVHDHRHLLLQAVGAKAILDIQTLIQGSEGGDRFLLCSDGLHDMIGEEEMAEILAGDSDPSTQCQALVDAALSQGGYDNITVIVLHLD